MKQLHDLIAEEYANAIVTFDSIDEKLRSLPFREYHKTANLLLAYLYNKTGLVKPVYSITHNSLIIDTDSDDSIDIILSDVNYYTGLSMSERTLNTRLNQLKKAEFVVKHTSTRLNGEVYSSVILNISLILETIKNDL